MKKQFLQTSKIIVLAIILTVGMSYAMGAWTSPPSTPPNSNTEAPVNVGGIAQYKSGGLVVGGLRSLGPVIFDALISTPVSSVCSDSSGLLSLCSATLPAPVWHSLVCQAGYPFMPDNIAPCTGTAPVQGMILAVQASTGVGCNVTIDNYTMYYPTSTINGNNYSYTLPSKTKWKVATLAPGQHCNINTYY